MFKIYDGREYFYQWDIDRKLIIEDPSVTEVHFTNRATNDAYVCETYVEDDKTLVNVPNILLQTNWRIQAYAYDGKQTKHDKCYEVRGRSKPADYVYTETEVLTWESIKDDVDTLNADVSDLNSSVVSMDKSISTIQGKVLSKQDKPTIITYNISTNMTIAQIFANHTSNYDRRYTGAAYGVSVDFSNGVYNEDYISSLSFDSGETPTKIDYTNSGILNWVGTDCSVRDGYSIFKPAANKHYEIVFYFNGTQFIGLVNGFVPSLGNVVE